MCRRAASAVSGIAGRDRRRHHDDVGVADVVRRRGRCAIADAEARQPIGHRRSLRVGAADLRSRGWRAARRCRSCRCRRCRRSECAACVRASTAVPRARAARTRGRRSRAPRRASPGARAAAGHRLAARRVGGERDDAIAPARRRSAAPARSSSAAPARRQHLGVLALVIVGRGRQRNEHRRRPAAVSSASVVAPARQITRSAAFISRSMAKRNGSTRASRPARAIPVADAFQIAFSCLMRDCQPAGVGCQPRRRRHHGHVDRVRALGAAKDQNPRRRHRLAPRERSQRTRDEPDCL